jgi:hypothetical protein
VPNKSVAGYTQIPVVGGDITRVVHDRLNEAGTITQVTADYQFKDDQGAVRGTATVSFQSGAYPATPASLIAACNAQQGT